MVYIYKKIIGTKPYYYLRASVRKEGKIVIKDIAYLGNSLEEAKKALDALPKYKEQIRKAYKTINNFLESNRFAEKVHEMKLRKDEFVGEKLTDVEACKLHYNSVFKKQPELTKQEIIKNFIVEFSFNTTSMEGNTIKLDEARNLLEDGLTPKNKTLREIYDVQNTEKVFMKLLNSKEELTHELIIKIHAGLMENIDARTGYRTTDVRVIKSNFDATPAPYVKTDMNLLLKWYDDNKNKLHPLVLAVIFHHKFEKIHPFMDGNGRTGRMLLNYILMKSEYPPLIIHKKTRVKYLQALRIADENGINDVNKETYRELVVFDADELIQTYWNIFL
ncbi:Fic family protein [Candidatus Woesearchaeota archaeon]|nr:Fic family protein [Candidatus Woesearchaeota archaeon]